MLIRNNYYVNESTSILENATYLSEYESTISPYSIPIVENTRLGTNIVNYEDIERLCEEYGWSISKAMNKIANSNHTDNIVVSIEESTVVATPYITNYFRDYVIRPMSESHIVSRYVDYCVNAFLESGDIGWMEYCVDPYAFLEAVGPINEEEAAKSAEQPTNADTAEAPKAAANPYNGEDIRNKWTDSRKAYEDKMKNGPDPLKPGFLSKLKKYLLDKPRNFIARMATRLRGLYKNFLEKANQEKSEDKIKWYKNIARIILKGIDWVVDKLQNFHVDYEKRSAEYDKKKAEYDKKNPSKDQTAQTAKAAADQGKKEENSQPEGQQ